MKFLALAILATSFNVFAESYKCTGSRDEIKTIVEIEHLTEYGRNETRFDAEYDVEINIYEQVGSQKKHVQMIDGITAKVEDVHYEITDYNADINFYMYLDENEAGIKYTVNGKRKTVSLSCSYQI